MIYICSLVAFGFISMGWQQFVDSFKILVSFAKEPCKRDLYLSKKDLYF